MVAGRNKTLWLMLAVCSMLPSLTLAKDCQSVWDWSKEYCCKDKELKCFNKDPPYDDFRLPCCYDDNDVTYNLYTRSNRYNAELIHKADKLPSEFSGSKRTVFIIHGWKSHSEAEQFVTMRKEFLDREDLNVVSVDWPSDRAIYSHSASETRPVGRLTSLIMKKLVDEGRANYDRIWCVGHSLGSHVCGHAGRDTPEKISRITGLDPAGQKFETNRDITVGLNPNDAKLVDIIHTDYDGTVVSFGTLRPLGHLDFYLNGGDKNQPDCWNKRKKRNSRTKRSQVSCSHSRVITYFTESIMEDCFISREKCKDYTELPGSCSPCRGDGVCAVMGYGLEGDNGIYNVNTNRAGTSPHCLG